jgi:PAS domain S-box-containing protein
LNNKSNCPLKVAFSKNKPGTIFNHQTSPCIITIKNSSSNNVEFSGFPVINEDGNINYMVELTADTRHLNSSITKQNRITSRELALRNQLAYIFITSSHEEMYAKILQIFLKTLRSNYGIMGYIDQKGSLVLPAITQDIWDLYRTKQRLPISEWRGLWGKALLEKKSFFSNNSFLPPKRNFPIKNGIVVPIVYNEETIGLIIIGDKEKKFNNKDRKLLEHLSNYIAPVLQSRLLQNELTPGGSTLVEESEVREMEGKYRSIFNTAASLITSINKRGLITDCNNKIFEILGYNRDEIIGAPMLSVIHPLFHSKARNTWKDPNNGSIKHEEFRMIKKNGEEIYVSVNSSNIVLENKKDRNSIWFIEDITKQKLDEQEILADRNRAEVYLDILGHDISNMNQAIASYSELLLLKPDLSDQYRKYVQTTLNQSRAISDLISNISKLSKLRKEKLPMETIDIFKVFANASELVQHMYPHRKLTINETIFESEVLVESTNLIKDVFINILINAIKFDINEHVIVDVDHSLSEDGNFWKIELKDHGPGVPDIMKLRIFNRFEKGDESTRGSGLGLAVVKEIMDQCGGKVWVDDRIENEPSQGSNFVLLIPRGG